MPRLFQSSSVRPALKFAKRADGVREAAGPHGITYTAGVEPGASRKHWFARRGSVTLSGRSISLCDALMLCEEDAAELRELPAGRVSPAGILDPIAQRIAEDEAGAAHADESHDGIFA